jgi:cyanophycinase
MTGWLALVGGAEFRRGCEQADRVLLGAIGSAGARVAILPTAAAAEGAPRMAAANGVRHFKRLGADAFGVMVVDGATANDPSLAAQLAAAQLVYIAGGDPGYLLRSLSGSLAQRAMLEAWHGGAVLAGSSAGAMVLCEAMWNPKSRRIEPALGLVRHALVVPHHRPGSEWARQVATASGGDHTLLGIAEETALIWDGMAWQVHGPGEVTVYSRGEITSHSSGQTFQLDGVKVERQPTAKLV